jgi:hypothetical protein
VVVPRFRRRALATLPYLFWAVPALVAQLRFSEPAAVDGGERVALAQAITPTCWSPRVRSPGGAVAGRAARARRHGGFYLPVVRSRCS